MKPRPQPSTNNQLGIPRWLKNQSRRTRNIKPKPLDTNNMGNYLKKHPDGSLLGNEKSPVIAGLCDEKLTVYPEWDHIPAGLILIAVVENQGWEAALVVDNKYDYDRVRASLEPGSNDTLRDERKAHWFLVKREWVRQMADKPLESDGGARHE